MGMTLIERVMHRCHLWECGEGLWVNWQILSSAFIICSLPASEKILRILLIVRPNSEQNTVSVISWKKRTAKMTRIRIPHFYLSVPYPPSLVCNITGNLVSQFHQQLTTPTALFWRNIHTKNNLVLVAQPVAFIQSLRHKINKQTNR